MNIIGLVFYFALIGVSVLVGWFIGFITHDIDCSRYERRTFWETTKRLFRLFGSDVCEFVKYILWGDRKKPL